jgi:hypothetical protein
VFAGALLVVLWAQICAQFVGLMGLRRVVGPTMGDVDPTTEQIRGLMPEVPLPQPVIMGEPPLMGAPPPLPPKEYKGEVKGKISVPKSTHVMMGRKK